MKFKLIVLAAVLIGVNSSAGEQRNQQTIAPEFMLPSDSRAFSIEYAGKISAAPEGTKKLRVWLPVPQSSTVQTIRDLSFSEPPRLTTEPKYGNKIAFWEFEAPKKDVTVIMKFTCERKAVAMDLSQLARNGKDTAADFTVFMKPDRLVIVDDEIRKIARDVTRGKKTTLEKSRAIYDYVLGKMVYDKNHPGWGLGSTKHACDVGKGNCTDFHALFNSLCRAEGIPSGFEIGLYLPYEKGKEEPLGGYHCWAFFRVPGKTWVPVDCSEANRFPERKEYFFGGHTSNRVTLSTGRDIMLEPAQTGEPLNYFLNPYAEADGQAVKTEKTWSFRDLN